MEVYGMPVHSMYVLSPSKFRPNKKRIYGFDIETYDNNHKFFCASLYGDDLQQTFLSKETLIQAMKSRFFCDTIIVATNLGFDFFGTFFGDDEIKNFNFIFRGSDLLYAKTYIYNKRFNPKSDKNKSSITFLDTLNYAKMSVDNLGKMLGIPKLKKPACLGLLPSTDAEREEMIIYNMRDSEISQKALKFFYESFEKLGASPKLTLASTSMPLYRNVYLKDEYHLHTTDVLLNIFKGYYGGRTEAFARGTFENYNYYDFNSLYPAVMCERYPDPNTLRITKRNDDYHIISFEGMSDVEIHCPHMDYPLLPFRFDNKLLFPTGTFRGWYTHIEIKKAITLGYVLKRVHKTYYYKETCLPFRDFVEDMYAKRLSYKKSPMGKVTKILMNSLYGKFGQKFQDKDNLIPFNHTVEELAKLKKFEVIGRDYIRVVEDRTPSAFCIPIWASYVTAYGRIKLHDYILLTRPLYVDTDSLITKKELTSDMELGNLKLEYVIKKGTIVKPKFYCLMGENGHETVKIKGVGTKLVFKDFYRLMVDPTVEYTKFMKLRESVRRGMIPNEIVQVLKRLNLEDNKRIWKHEFSSETLEFSQPRTISEEILNAIPEKHQEIAR